MTNPKEIRELDQRILTFQRQLYRFYITKIKQLAIKESLPIEFFQKKYDQDIEIMIHQFIETVYFDRIQSLRKQVLPVSITRSRSKTAAITDIFTDNEDINKIAELAKAIKDNFVAAVARLIGRYESFKNNPFLGTTESLNPFNEQAAFKRLSSDAGYKTYNEATLTKLGEADPYRKIQYITAEDERVCPICFPFNRQIFRASSQYLPRLPQHPNCRCYYLEKF